VGILTDDKEGESDSAERSCKNFSLEKSRLEFKSEL
jgi:hypothetical protein